MPSSVKVGSWDNVSVSLCFISLGLAFALSVLRSLKSKASKKAPGPTALPLLGNLFTFLAIQKRPDLELLELAQRYGSYCMLWFGWNPVVLVSSPSVIKELMDKRGNVYSSRPEQNDFRAKAWPWRLVTTPTGETFRLLRRLYHNLLGPSQSAKFRKYQAYESLQLLQTLLEKPDGFLMDVERFAMSVIFSACYGVRLVSLDHPVMREFYDLWESMLRYFQPGALAIDFLPILQRLPKSLQWWSRLAYTQREREQKLHRAFLRTLKAQVEADSAPECFGTHLIEAQVREGINDDRACDILAMLIGAGADTTSSYLQSFFKVMALHPEIVRNAHQELDEVVGSSRMPDWEDEMRLPYIRAIIKEVHRWAPIGSLGIPHATSGPDVYDGVVIPKGTIVFPNLTALSRSTERYINPDKFDPSRFLGDDLDASASALHPDFKRRDHFHYGFGRRLCQGIFVAEASLYIVVARVLWGFNISPFRDAPRLNMADKISGLVTKPKPYRVRIESRGAEYAKIISTEANAAQTDIMDFDDVKFVNKEEASEQCRRSQFE